MTSRSRPSTCSARRPASTTGSSRRCPTSPSRPARSRARRRSRTPGSAPTTSTCCRRYDSFTITALLHLEDLGFCAKGEGGAFVEDGKLGPGGALPMNTNGGGLSYTHPGQYGMFLLVEAARQLRGECRRRARSPAPRSRSRTAAAACSRPPAPSCSARRRRCDRPSSSRRCPTRRPRSGTRRASSGSCCRGAPSASARSGTRGTVCPRCLGERDRVARRRRAPAPCTRAASTRSRAPVATPTTVRTWSCWSISTRVCA